MPSIQDLERLLRDDPGDAFLLYGLAHEYARTGRHDAAIEHYDRCLVADPGMSYAYYHKARSLVALGRAPEAVLVLRAGIERARAANDSHAVSELVAMLDELT
ncbi:MAG: tetratricopeptide repeat protein [Phycisphaeraceae bacterium]|nr:tetratricopeptide repeat protein [Phycisphaerae bacterium]MBX3392632.1 tetratricopeptide repeat protein [Phycisphaeraceae bacterium]